MPNNIELDDADFWILKENYAYTGQKNLFAKDPIIHVKVNVR